MTQQTTNTLIALLRGINVGGNNKLPMRELTKILETLDLQNVKTYIQSGNAVFQSERTDISALAQEISAAIGESHGFSPQVFVLSTEELQNAIDANPFPEGEDEPKSLHFFFLDAAPKDPDWSTLAGLKTDSERYKLINKVFYLHAPDGIGRSKLAEKFGRGWDVGITARNWRTVSKIMAMAAELSE